MTWRKWWRPHRAVGRLLGTVSSSSGTCSLCAEHSPWATSVTKLSVITVGAGGAGGGTHLCQLLAQTVPLSSCHSSPLPAASSTSRSSAVWTSACRGEGSQLVASCTPRPPSPAACHPPGVPRTHTRLQSPLHWPCAVGQCVGWGTPP